MPIYEYQCRACGADFELLVLGSDVPACPGCQSEDLARQLSLPHVSSEHTRRRSVDKVHARRRAAARDKAIEEERATHRTHDHDH